MVIHLQPSDPLPVVVDHYLLVTITNVWHSDTVDQTGSTGCDTRRKEFVVTTTHYTVCYDSHTTKFEVYSRGWTIRSSDVQTLHYYK